MSVKQLEKINIIPDLPSNGPSEMIPARSEASAVLNMIERASRDPSVDVDKLRQLMEMREQAQARLERRAFNAAMTQAQKEMAPVRADATNPQTRSRYASYAALDRAIRPIYTRNGFGLSFNTGEGAPENYVRILCDVTHDDGHEKQYHIDMPADGKGAKGGDVMTKTHATGSAASYGTRYLLKMIFNIAVGEDDDGNKAGDTGAAIFEAQADNLIDLIESVGADRAKFLQFFKIETISDLPAKRFGEAVAMLNAKRK